MKHKQKWNCKTHTHTGIQLTLNNFITFTWIEYYFIVTVVLISVIALITLCVADEITVRPYAVVLDGRNYCYFPTTGFICFDFKNVFGNTWKKGEMNALLWLSFYNEKTLFMQLIYIYQQRGRRIMSFVRNLYWTLPVLLLRLSPSTFVIIFLFSQGLDLGPVPVYECRRFLSTSPGQSAVPLHVKW